MSPGKYAIVSVDNFKRTDFSAALVDEMKSYLHDNFINFGKISYQVKLPRREPFIIS